MNLVIFGATGGIGRQCVEQALQLGHAVTAVARNPAAITTQHARLRVLQGDVLQPASLAAAVVGQDAVVSAIGNESRAPTTLYSQGVMNIVAAMNAANMRRLVCVSASALEIGSGTPLLLGLAMKLLVQPLLREPYADLRRMEAVLRTSPLDWTSVRPPRLSNGPYTGRFQVAPNQHQATASVSRADVAACILTCLKDAATIRQWVELARTTQ